MNQRYIPLDASTHLTQGWADRDDYRHLAGIAHLPVVLAEAQHVTHLAPLAFLPDPGNAGRYQWIAVLAPHAGDNLFVDQHGRWLAGYVPAMARAHPFVLIPKADPETPGQLLIGLDTQSTRMRLHPNSTQGEHRFFDDLGKLSAPMQQRASFLAQLHHSQQATQQAVSALTEADLLVPWTPGLPEAPGQKLTAEGLYHVDIERMRRLDPENLAALQQVGALDLAYAQHFSESRISLLLQLYQLRARQSVPAQPPVGATALDGELSFSPALNSGTLNLSFLNGTSSPP